MTTFLWNDFPKLTTAVELQAYMHFSLSHTKYYHYTSLSNIDSILGGKSFWLSSTNNFNDRQEFCCKKNPYKYYALCFTSGVDENIALWYLYSGKNGGRFEWTPTMMERLIKTGDYELVEYKCNNRSVNRSVAKLIHGKNAVITFQDVLYAKSEVNHMAMKYNTMTNYRMPHDEFDRYANNNSAFIKKSAWYFEKETRLLVELDDTLYQSLSPNSEYRVVLTPDSKVWKYTKIRTAPEADCTNTVLANHSNIQDFINNISRNKQLLCSEFTGLIHMCP